MRPLRSAIRMGRTIHESYDFAVSHAPQTPSCRWLTRVSSVSSFLCAGCTRNSVFQSRPIRNQRRRWSLPKRCRSINEPAEVTISSPARRRSLKRGRGASVRSSKTTRGGDECSQKMCVQLHPLGAVCYHDRQGTREQAAEKSLQMALCAQGVYRNDTHLSAYAPAVSHVTRRTSFSTWLALQTMSAIQGVKHWSSDQYTQQTSGGKSSIVFSSPFIEDGGWMDGWMCMHVCL